MSVAAALSLVPELDGADVDRDLLARLDAVGAGFAGRVLHAAAPSFRAYAADDFPCQGAAAFPAFSITGGACALGCVHCGGRILAPMRAVTRPEALEAALTGLVARGKLRGFLLSGGSDRRNQVRFEPFLPVVARFKRDHPGMEVAVHTGLVDVRRAEALAAAGVDVAMMDVIGDEDTIRDVYRLDRPVADFADSLRHLVAAGLRVVPHVVVGLHFGHIRGEPAALDIIAREKTAAAILVVLMPHLAEPGRFTPVNPSAAGSVFGHARTILADRTLLLGCARPPGRPRALMDLYALAAGLDGISHPTQGIPTLAHHIGRRLAPTAACCGVAA
jgi:hypothetical protein